jgi:hypothetical protein
MKIVDKTLDKILQVNNNNKYSFIPQLIGSNLLKALHLIVVLEWSSNTNNYN